MTRRNAIPISGGLLTIVVLLCGHFGHAAPAAGFVRVSGRSFLDANGKPLILHGINMVNKRRQGADPVEADFDAVRGWGMNCIRLGFVWDGVEPEPGKIDAAYIDRIAHLVDLAKARGLYVFLDMHQDLYSAKFGDGAPAWATLDDGQPHTRGNPWSDAYYASEAVHASLDHFWANRNASDGVGLQEHYAQAWQALAKRFAGEPWVVGYDIMNEPPPGEDFRRARDAAVAGLAPQGKPEALMVGPDAHKQFLELMQDAKAYGAMLDKWAPLLQAWERTRLMPFYTRVAHAIRQVDSRHILVLEPGISSAHGVRTAITPLSDANGKRDPQQAFSPHAYDITTDNAGVASSSNARMELIMAIHDHEARRLNMPMWVGEWGAFYNEPSAAAMARFTVGLYDRYHSGDAYWSYERRLASSPILPALARPAPK
jgi:endoglycosylceramidase